MLGFKPKGKEVGKKKTLRFVNFKFGCLTHFIINQIMLSRRHKYFSVASRRGNKCLSFVLQSHPN